MKDFFNDLVNQVWTILGLFIAWLCLDGVAKDIVGWLTIASVIVWVATFPLRKDGE